MPFKLYFKIKSHLLNISNKRKKTGISLLINGIPDTIKIDLLFRIYAKIIKEFSIFKNVKNSNFIIQVLTSFIPITLKKEEILLLEGEMVENIIFVKDGRLSMEIIIDLKEPYKSIQHYIEVNFRDINRKDLRALNKIKSANTLLSRNNINYKDLKHKIDNFLLDQQKKVNDNRSLIDHNGISANLGRLDFSKKQSDLNIIESYETIKIFDVRKNDYFGEVNMFLEKPSPFTLKAKSRIAEVFLLHKQEATTISKNFPNIWRKIHRKAYHNFYSLKKLAIRTLKRYYNSHFYHKNKNEKPFSFNLDNSSSIISFLEKPSFLNKITTSERLNLIKPSKNVTNKIKTVKSTQIFKNHIYFEKNNESEKRKTSLKTMKHSYCLINDGSSKNSNISSVKFDQSSAKPIINIISNNFQSNTVDDNSNKKLVKTKTFEKITFREDENNNRNEKQEKHNSIKSDDISIKKSKKINNNTSIDYYKEIIQSIYNSKKDSKTLDSLLSKTNIFNNDNFQDIINNISNQRIFTLKDVDEKLSKKIRKKIKMRKKIEKLKHSLELKRKENNKHLIALYSNIISQKLNLISKNLLDDNISKDLNHNIAEELINTTLSKYNNDHFSDLLESTTSEEDSPKKFDTFSLKQISPISFVIKSSYKNLNKLSKGEIINNKKYKKFLENMIKQNTNKHFFNKVDFKRIVSKYSIRTNRHKNTNGFRRISTEKLNKNNKNKRNTVIQKSKFKSTLLSNINDSSKKIVLNISNQIIDDDFNINNKNNSSKAINDKMDNSNKIFDLNKSNIKMETIIKDNNNTKDNNNNTKTKNIKKNRLGVKRDDKKLLMPNEIEKKRKSSFINNTIINNKSYASSLNYFNEIDKDNASRSENHLKQLNKKDPMKNSLTKELSIDENLQKKCDIF
jgi:CRP-like cAMP-binding protein